MAIRIEHEAQSIEWNKIEATWVLLPSGKKPDVKTPELPQDWKKAFETAQARYKYELGKGQSLSFDINASQKIVVSQLPKSRELFWTLEKVRHALKPLLDSKPSEILVDIRAVGDRLAPVVDAVVAGYVALTYQGPKYQTKKKDDPKPPGLCLLVENGGDLEDLVHRTKVLAEGTNLVRHLSVLAPNDLTPSRYVTVAQELAAKEKLKTEFFSLSQLEKMGAGAFVAVSRGASDRGGGILKIAYGGKAKDHIALVGKGITFDTGGNNLKTGSHMFGMNGDMAGSAVALALVLAASKLKLPYQVTAYLAITENSLTATSYRPNDVVTALSGKTIEVIDTDAEGRMILADALALAGREKPRLMIDFATLTGACVRAIGTNYSGAYTNRRKLMGPIRKCGRMSGERVWPFPNDRDYGRCLKSEIADIKQCRLQGGSDHIEAGYFLSRFVPKETAWVHVDLSASEREEGLAHVPGKATGFGVRLGMSLMENLRT